MPHAAFYVVQHRYSVDSIYRIRVSMPHAAFYVVQLRVGVRVMGTYASFNAARGFLCGATFAPKSQAPHRWVSMPHAAFYVVQLTITEVLNEDFVKFQCRTRLFMWCNPELHSEDAFQEVFQCRTRLSMWCNANSLTEKIVLPGFNAARGFLCGATDER